MIWELPLASGAKHIASIIARISGRDIVGEHFKDKLLTALAELAYNEGKPNALRECNKTSIHHHAR